MLPQTSIQLKAFFEPQDCPTVLQYREQCGRSMLASPFGLRLYIHFSLTHFVMVYAKLYFYVTF